MSPSRVDVTSKNKRLLHVIQNKHFALYKHAHSTSSTWTETYNYPIYITPASLFHYHSYFFLFRHLQLLMASQPLFQIIRGFFFRFFPGSLI